MHSQVSNFSFLDSNKNYMTMIGQFNTDTQPFSTHALEAFEQKKKLNRQVVTHNYWLSERMQRVKPHSVDVN